MWRQPPPQAAADTIDRMTTLPARRRTAFQQRVFEYYAAHGRHDLPWRQLPKDRAARFYYVWISEMMLQQTQVGRVVVKYQEWMARFPDIETLARASLSEVLAVWQGLGYNRRAKFVRDAAATICTKGIPHNVSELVSLPGIGKNTAGAILAYVDNSDVVFIETNIREAIIHEFFITEQKVSDKAIEAIAEQVLVKGGAREWYWALMDYGSHLKRQGTAAARRSAIYKRQSAFQGSIRQLRGEVLRRLQTTSMRFEDLAVALADDRTGVAVAALEKDGLVRVDKGIVGLP